MIFEAVSRRESATRFPPASTRKTGADTLYPLDLLIVYTCLERRVIAPCDKQRHAIKLVRAQRKTVERGRMRTAEGGVSKALTDAAPRGTESDDPRRP